MSSRTILWSSKFWEMPDMASPSDASASVVEASAERQGIRLAGASGEPFECLDQRGMVTIAVSRGNRGIHELLGRRSVWQSEIQRTRSVHRQRHVLSVQADPKARIERLLDHALAVHFEDPARGKSAHQRLAHLRGIGACSFRKQERFRYGLDCQPDNDLVGDLCGLTVTDTADTGDVLAHLLEKWPCPFEGLFL